MLTGFFEALLPGVRQLRPPLISGLLWALLLWVILADLVPEREAAEGWARQAYAIANAAGPVTTGVVLSVLVFALGAMLSGVSDLLSGAVGKSSQSFQRAFRWQIHAHRTRRQLRREVSEAGRQAEAAQTGLSESDETKRQKLESNAATRKREYEALRKRLEAVDRKGWRRLLIRRSPLAEQALGSPPATAGEGLERELVYFSWTQGANAVAEEEKENLDEDALFRAEHSGGMVYLDRELQTEINVDPLEVVRALSEPLYLDLDRTRAEREVRIAIATPVLFMGIYAASQWSLWWALSCLIPLSFIVRFSFASTQEQTVVLHLLRLHDLKTPALRRAFQIGRTQARLIIQDARQRREKHEREEREERERAQSRERQAEVSPAVTTSAEDPHAHRASLADAPGGRPKN